MRLLDEVVQHLLGDFEVGDDAILHRLDGHDVARRAAQHLLGFFAHGLDFSGVLVDGHDGGLVHHKAFDVLIDAMAHVQQAYLWIAGAGPEEKVLKQRTAALGLEARVLFLGWRDDTEAVLSAGDIFVCPSRHEPLGNVVIEAFAQGLPVVATASQGPKALIEDGVNGLLTPVDDAAALASAVNRVIADAALRYALAHDGFATYQRQFTEAVVVANYRAFFEKVKR